MFFKQDPKIATIISVSTTPLHNEPEPDKPERTKRLERMSFIHNDPRVRSDMIPCDDPRLRGIDAAVSVRDLIYKC